MYASGKKAWGISDRSGRRYRLHEMRVEWTGAKVGPDEFDPKQPQLFPPKAFPDPQAWLRKGTFNGGGIQLADPQTME